MSGKSEATRAVDARTNQPIKPLAFDVDSPDDYLKLRAAFAALPKIPTLLRPEEQPTATAPNRSYNWLAVAQQRLPRDGGALTPEAQRKVMEDHDYVFHDRERYERAAAEAAARQAERRGDQR